MVAIVAQAGGPVGGRRPRTFTPPQQPRGPPPSQKQPPNFGPATPFIAFAIVGIPGTYVWGIVLFGWLFSLLQDIFDIVNPGMGIVARWLLFLIFPLFFPHVMISMAMGSYTQSTMSMDPKTGQPMRIYKSMWKIAMLAAVYWAATGLYIILLNPTVTSLVETGFSALIQATSTIQPDMPIIGGLAGKTPELRAAAQRAGLKVTVTDEKVAETLEEKLCGVDGYTKRDEGGNSISGGKQIKISLPPDTPPVIIDGIYRPTVIISNLATEPLKVSINEGQGEDSYPKADGKTLEGRFSKAKGSYVTGKLQGVTEKGDDKLGTVNYLLGPLACTTSGPCEIQPGSSEDVPLLSTKPIKLEKDFLATTTIETKVAFVDDKAKGIGTGHILIFSDKEKATAVQKESDFKQRYCPLTFTGPLDVIVAPPFYIGGSLSQGGRGYSEGACLDVQEKSGEAETKVVGIKTYCIQNIKAVKIKLKNTDPDAYIRLTKLKVIPTKLGNPPIDGDLTPEYKRKLKATKQSINYNCFMEGEEDKINFIDDRGLDMNSGMKLVPEFSTYITFICLYRINDYPPGYPGYENYRIPAFKDYNFGVEVEYEYKTRISANVQVSESLIKSP